MCWCWIEIGTILCVSLGYVRSTYAKYCTCCERKVCGGKRCYNIPEVCITCQRFRYRFVCVSCSPRIRLGIENGPVCSMIRRIYFGEAGLLPEGDFHTFHTETSLAWNCLAPSKSNWHRHTHLRPTDRLTDHASFDICFFFFILFLFLFPLSN